MGRSSHTQSLILVPDGEGTLANSLGQGTVGSQVDNLGNTLDTQGTNDSGDIGTQVAGDEETTLEDAGSDTP